MAQLDIFDAGYFTSTGAPVRIPLRSDFDFMEVVNYTQMAAAAPTRNVKWEWQRGMSDATGVVYSKSGSTAILGDDMTSGGFTAVNTSAPRFGASVAFTAITNADPPVVSTASTSTIRNQDVVKIYTSAASGNYQLAGMPFTIGNIVTNTSFELSFMGAPGDAAPGSGTYRKLFYDPVYDPRTRFITGITQAASAVVELSVTHGFVVGQKVQFVVPDVYGMTEINGLVGEITAMTSSTTVNTITVDIDTQAFTAFAFPRATDVPFTWAQVVPVGAVPTLVSAANVDTAVIAMELGTNIMESTSSGDRYYWRAWKAFRYSEGSIPSA